MFSPTLLILALAGLSLAGCTVDPMPPQVASSPVGYRQPWPRSATMPTEPPAAPVTAGPQGPIDPALGATTAEAANSRVPPMIAKPIVVVVPSYQLPSNITPVP